MTDILNEAAAVIADRMQRYGDPAPMHECLATVWNAYVIAADRPLTARDAAIMCALLKLVREACGGPLHDNLVDAVGYLRIAQLTSEAPEAPQPTWKRCRVCDTPTLGMEQVFDEHGNPYMEPRCRKHAE